VAGFCIGGNAGWDFAGDLAAAIAAWGVIESFHGDEVDYAVKSLGVGDRQLDGNTGAAPTVLDVVEQGAESAAAAGLGVVHLVDENDAGDGGFFGISPHPLGDGFNAVLRIDEDDCGFNGEQGGLGFVGEHVEAGGVDEIDLDALPLGKGDGVLHGYAAGYFFFVIGGDGRAIFDTALSWGHFGGMQQSGNQSGFAAVRMPHYSYVTDLTSLVRFMVFSLNSGDGALVGIELVA